MKEFEVPDEQHNLGHEVASGVQGTLRTSSLEARAVITQIVEDLLGGGSPAPEASEDPVHTDLAKLSRQADKAGRPLEMTDVTRPVDAGNG